MPHRPRTSKKTPLPANPVAAIQHLIRISQSLMTLAEKETQSLLVNDMLAFSIMQYEKEKLSNDYVRASESFRARLEEFRSADPNLLNRLERLQRDLTEKMNGNNEIVKRMRARVEAATQKNIIDARDLGAKRVRFTKDKPTESKEGAQT